MIEGMDYSDGEIETSTNNEIQNNSSIKVNIIIDHLNKNKDKISFLKNQNNFNNDQSSSKRSILFWCK